MTLPLIILKQTLTMALYMAAGFALYKGGKISKAGSKEIASLLLWLVIPSVIIDSFCVGFTPEKLAQLGWSTLLGALALVISIAVGRLVYPQAPVDNFAVAFSNAGFIGIPLVRQSLGDGAVFFLVGFVALLNLLQWTYGVSVLRGNSQRVSLKGIVLNPVFVSAFVGICIFVTGLGDKLPSVVSGAIKGVAATNAPLAMIVLGVYLAQTELASLVTTPRLYVMSGVRLILIPLITMGAFWLLPVSGDIKLAVLVAAAAPVGANVAVYAQLYDKDYPYACQTVALTTILSMLILPLIAGLGQQMFGA